MKKEKGIIPGKKSQREKNGKDLQSYMDELWGFVPNSGDEIDDIGTEEIGKGDGDGVVTTSEESEDEGNGEWGGKKVKEYHPQILSHDINGEDGCTGRNVNNICEGRNGGRSNGNYSDGEDSRTIEKKNVGKKKKRKKEKNPLNKDLSPRNEKNNFYSRDDGKKKKEEDKQKAVKRIKFREDEEEAPIGKTPLSKGIKGNAVNEKFNGWENPSHGAPKQKTKNHTPDEVTTKLNGKNIFNEKAEAKRDFMNMVHEIRKLTLPHLDKFQRKIVENHQVKILGGKFDKSPKVHYPELMFRKKSMKRYIEQRREREKMMGVKTQTGNYIDMQDVNRRKKRMKKERTSSKLF
ncbi:conserved Plasmodium protein, unknown function [Plasmodium knowlesi strain H]|uniref:Uncharacterized protein n=3 Tax=Plasmodium knowlesi TaxID=5850 RepID=A0A5K1VA77_PLAKH|nr:conserved protein, unknown function [Plasmodium knowlesi strain H]OTN66155.1 Uncharacterized protein PKNOH_S09548300 [Plasmodium knowlesi]CAA9989831.1 conserved protein, unknown function [Plasmodium knowlesi strain H]SBO24379.1 conserved Plasmodium protein, unknown function [Plasmodium knowlesi strain H]SBO26642.1 conserved Plasmodium protein, unknown function [Plasmodium knowlesi strain H]VVS79305.1 conserved protein, unknown function [Plasmodium knowlesi strain H]|eukprot:XP_002259846.1 hypothetical protein, conserved in Plasmodium species [Plasmodium knowlesi strain H]